MRGPKYSLSFAQQTTTWAQALAFGVRGSGSGGSTYETCCVSAGLFPAHQESREPSGSYEGFRLDLGLGDGFKGLSYGIREPRVWCWLGKQTRKPLTRHVQSPATRNPLLDLYMSPCPSSGSDPQCPRAQKLEGQPGI